jgi:transcriptional regulator with XRE-family HTH domain
MATEAEVRQALLRAQGRSVAELASDLGMTRQHAHRLLTGRRPADNRSADLDRALALGRRPAAGEPVYALGTLDDDALDLLPAGETQPLFASRRLATEIAVALQDTNPEVCVVPVWPHYAWRKLVAFHAAWGVPPEPKNLFLVDDGDPELPLGALLEELRAGFAETLRLRALGDDPSLLAQVETAFHRLH